MVTSISMIIGGFSLIIILVLVGFQLIKQLEHLKVKINWHSLELEMKRASEQKAIPAKRSAKQLPKRRQALR